MSCGLKRGCRSRSESRQVQVRQLTTRCLILVAALAAIRTLFAAGGAVQKPFRRWTLEEAVEILTDSPWARQETFTRVIGGVGSGVLGEKEIYNTFYLRFLSALPV